MTDELIERLQHATTVNYREGDAESTERALDEVCDRIGILIGELRATAADQVPKVVELAVLYVCSQADGGGEHG